MRRRVHPKTQTIFGIIWIIIGVCIIVIGPIITPQDIIHSLQRLVIPHLFYSPYFLIGGALIIMGLFIAIGGLVLIRLGYKEGDYF